MSIDNNSPQPSTPWWKPSKMERMRNLSPHELKLKQKRSQIWSARAQVVITMISVIAVVVAIWVAKQGQDTINRNSQTALRQSQDSQQSTAITALGSTDTAERIAGLLLLTQNVSGRFKLAAETGEPPADLHYDYTTVLQILSGYIRSHAEVFLTSTSTGPVAQQFGLGHGTPPASTLGVIPIDINYAADQLLPLLGLKGEVVALNDGQPAIDLSNDELYRQYWRGANFGWIDAYMPGIDLRGAELASSQWSQDSHLSGAYLQCADLEGADFRGADLSHADLRGANVQGADFRGAHIGRAQLTQLYGSARWPSWRHGIIALPVKKWNKEACLRNSQFWDYQSTSSSTSLPSPRPSSSATPKPSASKGK
jgi:hypothetical protein